MAARRVGFRVRVAAGCALLAIGVASASVAAAQPAGGGARDPLKLFEPMYPVFTSPRCANCHGEVDPIRGINHDKIEDVPLDAGNMLPGQDSNSQCRECHDENAATSVWRTPPGHIEFANKDPLKLCQEVRGDNGLQDGDAESFARFIDHLSNDQLIGFAFEGKRAMTDNDAQPPPMDRAQFVNLARRWLQEGKARCSGWSGKISQHITQSSPMTMDVTIDITVRDGEARAVVNGMGHQHQTGQGCYTRDDTLTIDSGNTTIPTDVNVNLNRDLPGATGSPGLPPNFTLPPGVPALPPGIPVLGDQNGYSLLVRMPPIDGTDHWEQVTPPGCGRTSGDMSFPFNYLSGVVTRTLDPNDPDHLHDTDVFQGPDGSSITTTWDLKRD